METVAIDFAGEDDLEGMADLLGELFSQEADFRPDHATQLRGLRLIYDNPAAGRLFVMRQNGAIVGMANALITISTAEGGRVVLLEDLIIHSAQRGTGLGRRLMEHVVAWARQEGMLRITLLTDVENTRARAVYGRQGFVTSSMRVMRRILR